MRCRLTRVTVARSASFGAFTGMSFAAASRPMSRIGIRMVVSDGESRVARGLSSKPTTESRRGTGICRWSAQSSRSMAPRSFEDTNAVGHGAQLIGHCGEIAPEPAA